MSIIRQDYGRLDRGGDFVVGVEQKVGTITIDGVTYERFFKIVDLGSTQQNVQKVIPESTNLVGWLSVEGTVSKYVASGTYDVGGWNVNIVINTASSFGFIYATEDNIIVKTHVNCEKVFALLEYYR